MSVPVSQITTREPLVSLYPKDADLVERLAASMRETGFSEAHPLHVWANGDESLTLVDGHQRLEAAVMAGITAVPVFRLRFADEHSALEYAIREQRDRRNLSPKDRLMHDARAIAALDRTKEDRRQAKAKNAEKNESPREPSFSDGCSAERTAAIVGTSATTVKRVRTVLDSDDEETKDKLLSGEITPKAAVRAVRAKKPKPVSTLAENKGFKRIPRRPLSSRAEAALSSIENDVEYLLAEVRLSDLGDGATAFAARITAVRKALLPLSKVPGEKK